MNCFEKPLTSPSSTIQCSQKVFQHIKYSNFRSFFNSYFTILEPKTYEESNDEAIPVDKAKVTITKSNAQTAPKSQRYIDDDEIEDNSKISKPLQDFFYKKMSKRIKNTIEFVEVNKKKKKKKKNKGNQIANEEAVRGIRLLNDTYIDYYLDDERLQTDLIGPANIKKPKIKRRIIEPDELGEDEKLKLSLIEGDEILQQTETKVWKPKKIRYEKVFIYREKKSILYLQEPQNEFTALRKKNNWNESKIANFHKNQKKN